MFSIKTENNLFRICLFMSYTIIIIIISLLVSFSGQFLQVVFHSNLSDRKSSQISRTLFSFLTDFNNSVIWMVLILSLIFYSFSLFSKPWELSWMHQLPQVTFMFHSYISLFLLSLWLTQVYIFYLSALIFCLLPYLFPIIDHHLCCCCLLVLHLCVFSCGLALMHCCKPNCLSSLLGQQSHEHHSNMHIFYLLQHIPFTYTTFTVSDKHGWNQLFLSNSSW